MSQMNEPEKVKAMYVDQDTLSTRISLHEKYSVNPYGWVNWVFDQYAFPDGVRALELGCGTGQVWRGREGRLPQDRDIILSDFSQLMLQKAITLLNGVQGFHFQQINAESIPFDDASFDAVIANHMLYHVPSIDRVLTEIRRVLRPGGRFYATTLGDNSLLELSEIYRALPVPLAFSDPKQINFTLENGQAQLEKHFSSVEIRQYQDALRVTNLDDMVAYIKSSKEIPEHVERDVRALLSSRLSQDGVLNIRKEQGMFVCS